MRRDQKLVVEKIVLTKLLIDGLWQFGIAIWTQKNETEHGNKYSVSLLEKERIQKRISVVYEKYEAMRSCDVEWMFKKTLEQRLQDNYDVLRLVWRHVLPVFYFGTMSMFRLHASCVPSTVSTYCLA